MRTVFLSLCFLFTALSVSGQVMTVRNDRQINKDLEQLLSEALKKGLQNNGNYSVYVLNNKKNKDVESVEAIKFLRQNGYIPLSASDKIHVRYGAKRVLLEKVTFISNESFRDYAFAFFNRSFNLSGASVNDGKFFIPEMKDSWYWGKDICSGKFKSFEHVLWTGDEVNGFINGSGCGFMPYGNGFACFRGSFIAGFPKEGTINISVLDKLLNVSNIEAHQVGYWDLVRAKNKAPGNVLDAMKEFARLTYLDNCVAVEEEYKRMLTLNKSYVGFTPNKEVIDQFETMYGDWPELDLQNELDKIKEMKEVSAVLEALSFQFDQRKYYQYISLATIFSFRYFWSLSAEKKDNDILNNALAIASNKGKDSHCVFNAFYATATPVLQQRMQDLVKYVGNARKEYARYEANVQKQERSFEEYKTQMCNNCKIDGKKTTFPKGYSEAWSFLFLDYPAHSEEDGKIILVNGQTINWRYVYDDNYKEIEAEGDDLFYRKEFSSVDEMINTIIEECKNKYCH